MAAEANAPGVTRTYSGVERAAIILLSMNDDVAAEILKVLDPDEVTQLSIAMVKLKALSLSSIDAVIDFFLDSMKSQAVVTGGVEQAERLLLKVFSQDQVNSILAEVSNVTGDDIWRKLATVDLALLVAYLKGEHPQTTALILSRLGPELGARVLRSFDRSVAADVIDRMLRLQTVQSEGLNRVEEALRVEFLAANPKSRRQDRHARVADIFNNFDSRSEAELMDGLGRVNPEAAEKVQHLMFTLKDILGMDNASIQTIIQQTDRDIMSRALRMADEPIKLLFFANMSARAVKRLEDDWADTPTTSRSDTEAAQATLLTFVKDLLAKGEIRSGRERHDDDDLDLSSTSSFIPGSCGKRFQQAR